MKIALDNYQMKAINIKGKNTLVVAAPGSGKTTVIINRVNHLIEERKVKVGNIQLYCLIPVKKNTLVRRLMVTEMRLRYS